MSMLVVEQKKGDHIIKKGELVCDINIILRGAVILKTKNDEFRLESGSVIGLLECAKGRYICDYVVDEDSLIVSYPYQNIEDFKQIFEEQPQYVYAFLHAILVQGNMFLNRYNELHSNARELYLFMVKQYREYQLMCKNHKVDPVEFQHADDIKAISLDNPIRQWEIDYIEAMDRQSKSLMEQFYMPSQQLCIGEIVRTSQLLNNVITQMELLIEYIDEKKYIIFNNENDDLINLWFELAKSMVCMGLDIEPINAKVRQIQEFLITERIFPANDVFMHFQKYWKFDFESFAKENEAKKEEAVEANISDMDSFEYIISYAGYEEERVDEIKDLMEEYRQIAGDESNDRALLNIRNRVNEMFFETYKRVFIRMVEADEETSTILMLFLRFGFMDPQLIDEEQMNELLEANKLLEDGMCEGVYTFDRWLKCIYDGNKENSKNEFDLDYYASLREMRKANKITAEEEKLLQKDKNKKIEYEIDNMLKTASRATYGRGAGYSPILSRYNMNLSVVKLLVTQRMIKESIEKIRAVDFRCFYREVLFFDPEHDSVRMMLQKEVMPDVILLPNIGQRGMMWQEVGSVSRESSARFLFPILSVADIDAGMLDVIGKYRWEICRKMQGVRWNDITEPSLTAEYYDYLEYYKKNRELSTEGKEKVKKAIKRAKGSYRDVFAIDYANWIKYESNGSFRLNKVARNILSRYCPFPNTIRYKLIENPMFKGIFSKYENLMIQQETKMKNTLSRYKNDGGEITEELMDTLHFYSR